MRSAIIPLFIPHEGCPYRCTFCNQWRITGQATPLTAEIVEQTIETYIHSTIKPYQWELAFYGGTFTALPLIRQQALLEPATRAIKAGKIQSIRLSTRPDCISVDIINNLVTAGVKTVELGVQSLSDQVLRLAKRGHTAAVVADAVYLLREAGIQVGIQLMPGLRGETWQTLRETIRQVGNLTPDFVRIYPVLVMEDTELAMEYREGVYVPLTMEKARLIAAWWRMYLARKGIRVIRLGLQATTELDQGIGVLAGPYHPAFGEQVLECIYAHRLRHALRGRKEPVTIRYAVTDTSKWWGKKHRNRKLIESAYSAPMSWEVRDVPSGVIELVWKNGKEIVFIEDEVYRNQYNDNK